MIALNPIRATQANEASFAGTENPANVKGLVDWLGDDPTNVQKLDPELRPYLENLSTFGLSLRSPLVYQVPFYSWKLANAAVTEKRNYLQHAIRRGEYDTALFLYERPYRFIALKHWSDQGWITLDQLRMLLPKVWVDAEFPCQYGDSITTLFARAGFVQDSAEAILPYRNTFIAYRGQPDNAPPGWSWSLRYEVAERFARRWERRGCSVYKCVVPRRAILGYFTTRKEKEIVFNPAHRSLVHLTRIPVEMPHA